MTERRVDGFFYGLFMDSDILGQRQVAAVNPRRAYVEGYAPQIGRMATLLPVAGARAYGMLFALTHDDLERLYGAPGLEDYRPEAVIAHTLDGAILPALCYNLRQAPAPGEADPDYAERLRAALAKLGFPRDYIATIC